MRGRPRRLQAAAALLLALALAALAWHFNAKPRHAFLAVLPDTLRVLVATVVVFGLCGFGAARLLLPRALRDYELLWVLPTGGCVAGLGLTLLGFAGVPYPVALVLLLLGGLALSAWALRRGGGLRPDGQLLWPGYLALLVLCVALVPMVLIYHFAAPVGTGSDAHVAAGAANFLKHAYPTGSDISQPLNQMPPTWGSKFPIYYAFAAVSSLSGLGTWQVLAPLAAALLAMAAVGMFLLARDVFRAPPAVALAAMALAGVDRMALHTVLNPYFNQTWGYFAMPFTVVLGWHSVQPGLTRRERGRTLVLLAAFGLVLVLAYPLAAPLPAVPLLAFAWTEHRRRTRAGEPVFHLRSLYRGRRSLIWMVPLMALLAIPVAAAVAKGISAAEVLAPGHTLKAWAGDMQSYIPFDRFLSLPGPPLGTLGVVLVLALAAWELRRQPRALSVGLGGLLAIGLLLSVYLRHRAYGYYFYFKLLAFIGPLLLLVAAIGAGRLRRAGLPLLAVLGLGSAAAVVNEISATGAQLGPTTVQLASWAARLPAGASIRLDTPPAQQLWVAYFLASHPVCSQAPLLRTDYPHVAISRKAQFILASVTRGRPADAAGPPLRRNQDYVLYHENPAVPGPSRCTRRRFDRIYSGPGHSRR